MAKPKGVNQKNKYKSHFQRIARYGAMIQSIYDSFNKEFAKAVTKTDYDGSKPFRFADYPTTLKVFNEVQAAFVSSLRSVVYRGTSEEWKESNLVQDLLVRKVLNFYGSKAGGEKHRVYFQTNKAALKEFQTRYEKEYNLSEVLWNQSKDYKDEMECAISTAIQRGTSAVSLSKKLTKYLNDFPSLKKDYKQKYGTATDCMNCEYRSIRLARSEINMAYRKAEHERWLQFDFVLGKEIKTTNSHKHQEDICDILAGKYPKDFYFPGWHPNCMCYEIPILKSEDEFFGDKDVEPIQEMPDNFNSWVSANDGRIESAKRNGKLPMFLSQNREILGISSQKRRSITDIARERHEKRDSSLIQKKWDNRKELIMSGYDIQIMEVKAKAKESGLDTKKLDELLEKDLKFDKNGISKIVDNVVSSYDDKIEELKDNRTEIGALLFRPEYSGSTYFRKKKEFNAMSDNELLERRQEYLDYIKKLPKMQEKRVSKYFKIKTERLKKFSNIEYRNANKNLELIGDKENVSYREIVRESSVYLGFGNIRISRPNDLKPKMQHISVGDIQDTLYSINPRLLYTTKEVQLVDFYNPDDAKFQEIYDGFELSYATGGEGVVTFYRNDVAAELYPIMNHEFGHNLDSYYSRISESDFWKKAVKDDENVSGLTSPTEYGRNTLVEDFAESVMSYFKSPSIMKDFFPNRYKILKRILN